MKIEIDYLNGVIQTKKVVPHDEYESIYKYNKTEILRLDKESEKNGISKDEKKLFKDEIKRLESVVSKFDSEPWCTDKSPIGLAIKTGVIELPLNQGGSHKVNIKIIE